MWGLQIFWKQKQKWGICSGTHWVFVARFLVPNSETIASSPLWDGKSSAPKLQFWVPCWYNYPYVGEFPGGLPKSTCRGNFHWYVHTSLGKYLLSPWFCHILFVLKIWTNQRFCLLLPPAIGVSDFRVWGDCLLIPGCGTAWSGRNPRAGGQ